MIIIFFPNKGLLHSPRQVMLPPFTRAGSQISFTALVSQKITQQLLGLLNWMNEKSSRRDLIINTGCYVMIYDI